MQLCRGGVKQGRHIKRGEGKEGKKTSKRREGLLELLRELLQFRGNGPAVGHRRALEASDSCEMPSTVQLTVEGQARRDVPSVIVYGRFQWVGSSLAGRGSVLELEGKTAVSKGDSNEEAQVRTWPS